MKSDEIQKLNKEFKNCQKTLTAFSDEASSETDFANGHGQS